MQWQPLNDIGVSNIICKTIISLFTPVCRCQRIVSFYKIYTSNDGQNLKQKTEKKTFEIIETQHSDQNNQMIIMMMLMMVNGR